MRLLVKAKSVSTSAGVVRGGDVVDLPDDEAKRIVGFRPSMFEVLEDEPAPKKPARKRAKK